MIIRKINRDVLEKALNKINKKYGDNIIFNRFDQINKHAFSVTLKCKDSKKLGHRLGFYFKNNGDRRRLINACWHVYGDFFDAIFDINRDASIRSNGKLITIDFGNWEDRNIGSIMNPFYYSEACECNQEV